MKFDLAGYSLAELLPHAAPMILLTSMLQADEHEVCCEVEITENSMFFESQKLAVPAWVGIEYMAQTIGVYAGVQEKLADKPVKLGFLLGSRRFESDVEAFYPGQRLLVKAKRLYQEESGLGAFGCEIVIADKVICQASLNVFSPDNVDEYFKKQS